MHGMNKYLALAAMLALGTIGCGTIYTERSYGPQYQLIRLTQGLSFEETVATLGAPDQVHQLEGGIRVCIYRSFNYRNFLGVYAEVDRREFVLTFVNGRLDRQVWAPTGTDQSILAMQTYTLGVNRPD